ncbi:2-amino-4-hydroxy-6-hydroxymethyldihydropteridine diphosphokinase [Compostimonas suwonensis]|uniref:2-amino-4-hydroxy-6- hydroxymethyldihydropteridine diphosphokinase n=1 Tax=Compostimonas suwonensis TaxID=1048394 RepID=UPI001FE9FC0E|nr:2-amino-4-hydroxy-6-hydroxymethyldihydropteridine diphosphokinase [Compostimonas suwonensis]
MTDQDSITLTGLRVHANHGLYDFERQNGQDFVVDVTAWLSLLAAGSTDDIASTVHYGELAVEIHDAVAGEPVDLIETLAERVARTVLAHDPVERVRVTVHKPDAPISVPFEDVAVTIVRPRSEHAVLALGSNLGDREATLRAAVNDLDAVPGITVDAFSPLYETDAVRPDGVDPDAPAYLNAVALVHTSLTPHELLAATGAIELAHGRVRDVHWGDRTLDIDIVSYGSLRSSDETLTLPHPRAAERDFVLVPWLDVDLRAAIPGVGSVARLVAGLGGPGAGGPGGHDVSLRRYTGAGEPR